MKIIIQEEYLQHEKNKVHRIFAIIPFLFGTTGIITVLAFDKYYWKVGILTEGWPDFSQGFLIRSIVIFISVFAIFYSLTKWNHEKLNLIIKDEWNTERWSIIGMFIVSLVLLFMFFFTTSAFSAYSKEDSIVEWGSFIFLIFSSLMFILSFIAGQKNSQTSKLLKWMLLLPAFAFFVMGMEEISWFQRVVEFNTPELTRNNMQNEFNLHNFATSKVENVYYFSAFLFLVVLPYFRNLFPTFLNDDRTEVLVPRPFISILGAFACAYNFDMWNIIFTQISFAGTVSILISYSIFTKKKDRIFADFALIIVILSQISFLMNGHYFKRLWEITEYKELLIPMACFVYALDVYFQIISRQLKRKNTFSDPLNRDSLNTINLEGF